eukprot:1147389-Pyramimonas_sp.AAC.1
MWKKSAIRAAASSSQQNHVLATKWVAEAFEPKQVITKALKDPGPYFGNLDIRIAADLIANINKIQRGQNSSHTLRYLASEVDLADSAIMKAGGLLSGRSILRIIQTHVTTREDHGQ